jgi:hypothetical protein
MGASSYSKVSYQRLSTGRPRPASKLASRLVLFTRVASRGASIPSWNVAQSSGVYHMEGCFRGSVNGVLSWQAERVSKVANSSR